MDKSVKCFIITIILFLYSVASEMFWRFRGDTWKHLEVKPNGSVNYAFLPPEPTLSESIISEVIRNVQSYKNDDSHYRVFQFSFYPFPSSNTSSTLESSKSAYNKLQLQKLHKLLKPVDHPSTNCLKMAKLGGRSCQTRADGFKPICMDYLVPSKDNCLVYSFGIGGDFTFEFLLSSFGCTVMLFDDSLREITYKNQMAPNLYFFNVHLGTRVMILDVMKKAKSTIYLYRPLDNIKFILGHYFMPIDILKMDIEGSEWDVLNESLCKLDVLNDTKQLIIEIHLKVLANFTNSKEEFIQSGIEKYNRAFQCLKDHHFELAWVIPNEFQQFISLADGFLFLVFTEQLWINTAKITRHSSPVSNYILKNIKQISRYMERRY